MSGSYYTAHAAARRRPIPECPLLVAPATTARHAHIAAFASQSRNTWLAPSQDAVITPDASWLSEGERR